MTASGSAPAITPVNGRTSTAARKLCMGKPSRAERAAPAADELVAATQPGLIISNYGATLQVEDANGLIHRCTVRKKVDALVCGDRVRWQTSASDEGVIVALEPRRSLLVRPDPRGQLKPMAANVDQLIVMTAPRRPQAHDNDKTAAGLEKLDDQLIDRYLVAAALCGIGALLVVNKMDIFTTAGRAEAEQLAHMYRAVGYRVLFTAAKLGMELEPLLAALRNKTSVISGQSGVGKSSLAKALYPAGEIKIGEVAAGSGAGRHTTTMAALYHLPGGGDLIDSPGVRDFALWQVSAAELARGYVEFQPHVRYCRFGDCSHCGEPDCAVEQAAARGEIHPRRYANYRRSAAAMN